VAQKGKPFPEYVEQLSTIGSAANDDTLLLRDASTGEVVVIEAINLPGGGGGGAVSSVNGQTGAVNLNADDIDDAATTHRFATAAQLSAVDALGTASTADTGDFDPSGSAAAAQAASQPLDADLTTIAAANNGAVLAATTASFTTADESKLDAIEAGADVTDTTNVTAAGALMDSEVDADLKTLSLPANTTISTFGASLIDDADNTAARSTLGLGTAATTAAADYATAAQGALADSATQPGDLGTLAVQDDIAVPGDITATGTPSASTFLRGDGSWATPAGGGGGDLLAANNLSDVASASTSLSNLGGQPLDSDLTTLAAGNNGAKLVELGDRYTAPTTTVGASLDLREGTNNGTNRARIQAPAALSDITVTLPSTTGTLYATGGTDVAVADGGTGRSTATTAYGIIAAGTTATGAQQTISPGTSGQFLGSNGASALPTMKSLAIADVASLQATLDAKQAADADLTALAAAGNSAVLAATTASFLTADETKLDGIEALADVTDATNVSAAGALMKVAGGASVENIGAVEENVEVANVATSKAMDASVYGRAVYTMTGNTTFSITNPAPSGKATTVVFRVKGAFTPTLPASFDFIGTPPAYVGTGEGTTYVATTEDGGTSYQVTVSAGWA
jgi:hypothetical protein